MPIKAMTCNLLRGGRDGDDERRLREPMSLIGAQRPDVLLLQETEARGLRALPRAIRALHACRARPAHGTLHKPRYS